MLELMDICNNHFIMDRDCSFFEIETDGVVGKFYGQYVPGAYLIIKNSFLNDGIYEISSVTDNKISTVETLRAEVPKEEILLISSAPSKRFMDLADEIAEYKTKNKTKIGLKSMRIDDYSEAYEGDGSWQSAFKRSFYEFRNVYDDIKYGLYR